MADELVRAIKVHQALHGYADGHRLLTSSTSLKPRDQKTMLIMSDVSGAGSDVESRGYLTGYPLSDSGVYAIARTWAATEMARPGCVWTHTLLIEFADLAILPSMSFLNSAFRRPAAGLRHENYSGLIAVQQKDESEPISDISPTSFRRILSALYGQPKEKILLAATEQSSQLVFAVWAQQWPRLRRSFRFCTSSFADRSSEGASFDLQFTSLNDRAYRGRFADVVDADRTVFPAYSWLEDAVEDIYSWQAGELRTFLKSVGGDIAGGRELFGPLCTLHNMIPHFGTDGDFIDDAITLIDTAFDATSANSLRTFLIAAVARHPNNINNRSVEFLLKHLDLLAPSELLAFTPELGKAIWAHKPEQLISLASKDVLLSGFAKSTISGVDISQLVNVATADSALLPQLISLRPEIIMEPGVWTIGGSWARDVLRDNSKISVPLLRSILFAGRADLSQEIIAVFGASTVLKTLSSMSTAKTSGSVRDSISSCLDVIIRSPSAIAEFLNSEAEIGVSILLAIATKSDPDYVPNDLGRDPWAAAIGQVSGQLSEPEQQYLSGYLLARAFGYRSNSQADLIEFAFDEIYFGALNQRLSDNAWEFLERALPRSWFFDWDRCQKLRDAVTDMYVNRDLPPETFTRITRDNSLFSELARLAGHNSRGRKYLKKVLRSLQESGGPNSRIKIVEKAL